MPKGSNCRIGCVPVQAASILPRTDGILQCFKLFMFATCCVTTLNSSPFAQCVVPRQVSEDEVAGSQGSLLPYSAAEQRAKSFCQCKSRTSRVGHILVFQKMYPQTPSPPQRFAHQLYPPAGYTAFNDSSLDVLSVVCYKALPLCPAAKPLLHLSQSYLHYSRTLIVSDLPCYWQQRNNLV